MNRYQKIIIVIKEGDYLQKAHVGKVRDVSAFTEYKYWITELLVSCAGNETEHAPRLLTRSFNILKTIFFLKNSKGTCVITTCK